MFSDLHLFTAVLGFLWFLVYWILGGVLFSLVALLRLGRIRKVRFSCLFTIVSFIAGVATAFLGVRYGNESINTCLVKAASQAEAITAIFGCGFVGIFGAFLLGAAAVVVGGFLIMEISKSKNKPWINLDMDQVEEEKQEGSSEFFS